MGIFKLKQDLPRETQDELARIEARISAGLTTSTSDYDFLTALTPYRYNRVLRHVLST